MAKTKKLIFQDVDFENNKILKPSSIKNANSSITMSNSNGNSKLELSSDEVSLVKENNSITLDQSKVVVSSDNFRIDGAIKIIEKDEQNNIQTEKFKLDKNSFNLNTVDCTINATSKKLSVQGDGNLKIESSDSDSNIVSNNMDAKTLAKAKEFSVDDKVFIRWDERSKSLIFAEKSSEEI